MYGLVITRGEDGDVIKVSSSKEKLFDIAVDEMKQYVSKNKKIPKDDLFLSWLEALQVKEIEMAIEIFGFIAEKNGNPLFMAITAAEIVYDA